jgi:hypothetical protein
LKKNYCYEQILEDIKRKKINNDKLVISFSDMIELDVQRTFFEENVDESRIVKYYFISNNFKFSGYWKYS